MATSTVSQGVKIGILTLLVVGGAYSIWKSLGEKPSGPDGYELTAKFRNAKGLKIDSAVEIAGVPVGEITGISIEGRYARVKFRVRREIKVYADAVVHKRAQSLLGGFYLELDPGHPESRAPGPAGLIEANERLGIKDERPQFKADQVNKEILNVTEATTPEEFMRRAQAMLPVIEETLRSVTGLSEDIRQLVNVPVRSMADRLNALVQQESPTVSSILTNLDASMNRIEKVTRDLRYATDQGRIEKIVKNLEDASVESKLLLTQAREEVELTGNKLRAKMDKLDKILDSTGGIAQKINEDEGTLGRLVNDATIADNIEDITDDTADFINILTGLKTYVGFRSEFSALNGLARFYVTVELMTRPDKGYLIAIGDGARGGQPQVSLNYDPSVDPNNFNRTVTIDNDVRFTFQFMKKWRWATFRYGLMESTGGIGVDLHGSLWGHELTLQTDVFDASFDSLPRIKFTAQARIIKNLYIIGGLDDVLNDRQSLPVIAGNVQNPGTFDEVKWGRDFFVGAILRFDDEDLAALLTVGGSAIGGAGGN